MTRSEAVALIRNSGGKFFSVRVRKRDGQIRVMNGRLNVKKGLAGGEPAYDFGDHDLIPYYDLHAPGNRRCINIPGILAISVGGVWVDVVDDPKDSKENQSAV